MTRDELIEKMARAIHETMSAQAVIEYLDNPFDASAIAQAVLTAIEAAGLCIVPVEATEAMMDSVDLGDQHWRIDTVYRLMIEAGRI